MTWIVAGAIVGSAAISAGVGIYGAKKQAGAIEESTDKATAAEMEMFYQSREDTAPWREAGEQALNLLAPKIQTGPGEFDPQQDPGYKFGYQEFVEKPLLRGASAQGRLGGGRNLKELARYSSDYASTKYNDFLNRWYKSLTPLQSMSGLGQTTATQQGQNALATGRMVGQNILAGGEARGSGYGNIANVVSSTAGQVGQSVLDQYYMNKYNPTGGTSNYYMPRGYTPETSR